MEKIIKHMIHLIRNIDINTLVNNNNNQNNLFFNCVKRSIKYKFSFYIIHHRYNNNINCLSKFICGFYFPNVIKNQIIYLYVNNYIFFLKINNPNKIYLPIHDTFFLPLFNQNSKIKLLCQNYYIIYGMISNKYFTIDNYNQLNYYVNIIIKFFKNIIIKKKFNIFIHNNLPIEINNLIGQYLIYKL